MPRGKRLSVKGEQSVYGRGRNMARRGEMQRKARNEGRRPTKVAAGSGKPRSRLGRQPVRGARG